MADTPIDPAEDEPSAVVPIEEEMKRSYLDYAMSVIVSRALPDVRDGMKPVHRRILYGMREGGYDASKPHRKSANIVGLVMGQYHPHGDGAIYDAMVRMAQPFSMRLPLVDGQGNFGSMDADPPAAMRYTEARLAKAALPLLEDIDKGTVDWRPNYDESLEEPVVLPAAYPNLLVNGAGGIAVGMATNIPPHNLGEVIDGAIALMRDPEMDLAQLMELIPGPDFPTGGVILGRSGAHLAYKTGRGSILLRGRCHIEEIRKDRKAIVVTEIPYQVNKAKMVERIAEVVRDKKVEGVGELRDESDRRGVRVVVEIKREFDPDVVLNQLYKFTPLQISFGVNMVALNGGRPEQMTLREVLHAFLEFREEVVTRRSAFELAEARKRAHVLCGLAVAVANIDDVIKLIRAAGDPAEAREGLMAREWPAEAVAPLLLRADRDFAEADPQPTSYRLSEAQARAILDLRLHRLTGLEREKISEELSEIAVRIDELLLILESRDRLLEVIEEELLAIREKFADPRRTLIDAEAEPDTDIEDLIQREDMVVTVSHGGYIKRSPLSTYRAQKRGGKGRAGMRTHEDDYVARLFVANTHTAVLFFSTFGKVYKLKVYKLPLGQPQARGKAMINLFPHLAEGEQIDVVLPLPEDSEKGVEGLAVVFATAQGKVRRNALADYIRVNQNGKIAMGLEEGDRLIGVKIARDDQDVFLAAKGGKAIRFPLTALREFRSRGSTGVRGMDLGEGGQVVSLSILDHFEITIEEREAFAKMRRAEADGEPLDEPGLPEARYAELRAAEQLILTVTEKGYGKRTSSFEYRTTGRGGQGVANIDAGARNGPVVASFPVEPTDQIMLVTDAGKLIRMPVEDIRVCGRSAQGVTVFRTEGGERVVSADRLDADEEDEAAQSDEAPDGEA